MAVIIAGFPVNVEEIYRLATLAGAVIPDFHGLTFSTFGASQNFDDIISGEEQTRATIQLRAAYKDAFQDAPAIQVPRILAGLPHDNSSVGIMQAAMGLTALTLMAVCLRIYSRVAVAGRDFKMRSSIRVEDWLIIPASISLILLQALQCYLVTHGGEGKHVWDITHKELSLNFLLLLPANIIFILALLFTKLSLVFQYRNFTVAGLDRNHFFRVLCVALGGVIVVGSIGSILGCIILCKGFDFWSSPVQQNCVATRERHLAISGFDVLTNAILVFMPLSILPSFKWRMRHKILISLFFVMGLIVCILSAIRTLKVADFYKSVNPSFDEVTMHFLFLLETQLIIVCSCMPGIRALVHHRLRGTTDFNTRRGSVAYNIAESIGRSKSTRVTIRSWGTNSSPNTPRSLEDEELELEHTAGSVAVAVKITGSHRHTQAFKKLPPLPRNTDSPDSIAKAKIKRVQSLPAPVPVSRVAAGKKRQSLIAAAAAAASSPTSGDISFYGLTPTPPISPGKSITSTQSAPPRHKKVPPPVKIPTVPIVKLILTPPPVDGTTPTSIHLGTIPPPLPPPTSSLPDLPDEEPVISPKLPQSARRARRTSSPVTSPTSSSFQTPVNRSSARMSCPPGPSKPKAPPAPLDLKRNSRLQPIDISLDSVPATPPLAKKFQWHSPPGTPGTPGTPLTKLRLTPPLACSPRFAPSSGSSLCSTPSP